MAGSKNNGPLNGGTGLPADPRVLKFLAQLVKGQSEPRRDLNRMEERHAKEFRMRFEISMDSHKDIQIVKKKVGAIESDVSVVKSDVSDLKVRMARVEKRLDGNGMPRSGSNGH